MLSGSDITDGMMPEWARRGGHAYRIIARAII
jgi:hypothetical protein